MPSPLTPSPGGTSDIRVGLAGFGPAGSFFHAPLIAATPGLRLSAVVTRDPGRAGRVRADHPGAEVVAAAEDLWDACDLVVIATPNRTHVPLAAEALKAGLPVVVDKPLAGAADEARDLVRLARDRGLMLTVFQNRRWDGDFLTLRRLLPELGEVRRFESRFERWRPVPKGGWREAGGPEDVGGTLFDLGSHLVDQALTLFGPVTHVYAETDVRRAGVRNDDDAFVALTHRSGTRSHLWMSAVAGLPGPRLRVLGSRAAYVKWGLDPQEERLRAGERPGPADFGRGEDPRDGWGTERSDPWGTERSDPWGTEPPERWGTLGAEGDVRPVRTEPGAYQRFYEGVVACLRDGARPPVPAEEAVAAIAVLEAARLSASLGQVVPVPAHGE
ncbi:Gfo/Idh/MocA family oxidoreductase [Microbispora triticiradicis]|uniref:Gfo/Idh/MocA family oxidoreductase n=1 Tax=Microbispora triticiradicis TaxID=2200763 RepID=UPI001AD6C748|nr:Gfo/Idh/MocA family oxidoreductase [Microbispora triticiradicis]MBO4275000.1 Gfo/Idh/MocA family oxidoreductase [Microbispora triticiradicis]